MLSDEEKKAIEYLKQNNIVEIQYDNYGLESIHRVGIDEKQIILNLIEKQSKEIEELKEYKHDAELTKIACCTAQNCEALNNCIKLERELQNADNKWEDKIKAKIEEWQKEKEFYNKDEDREWGQYNNWDWVDTIINEMQSLLEKE